MAKLTLAVCVVGLVAVALFVSGGDRPGSEVGAESADWRLAPSDEFWTATPPVATHVDLASDRNLEWKGAEVSVGLGSRATLVEDGVVLTSEQSGTFSIGWRLLDSALGGERIEKKSDWRVQGARAQRLLEAAGTRIVEHLVASETGMSRTWVLPAKPSHVGDLTIATELESPGTVHGGDGDVRVTDSGGSTRFSLSSAVLVDANGVRTPVASLRDRSIVRYRVPEELLSESTYPLALDPHLGFEFGATGDPTTASPTQSKMSAIGSNGRHGVLVWRDFRDSNGDIYVSRLAPDGEPLDPGGIRVTDDSVEDRFPAVAVGPDTALAVWSRGTGELSVAGALISLSTGEVISQTVFQPSVHHSTRPAVTAFGGDFVVAYHGIRVFRVDGTTGQVNPVDDPPLQVNHSSYSNNPSLVTLNGDIFVLHTARSVNQQDDLFIGHLRADDPEEVMAVQAIHALRLDSARAVSLPRLSAGHNSMLATWFEHLNQQEVRATFAQRLTAAGEADGEPTPIVEYTGTGIYDRPASAALPGSDDYLVVWNAPGRGVDAAILSRDSLSNIQNVDPSSFNPEAVVLAEGIFTKFTRTYDGRFLYGRSIGFDGDPSADAIMLAPMSNSQSGLSLAAKAGDFATAWTEEGVHIQSFTVDSFGIAAEKTEPPFNLPNAGAPALAYSIASQTLAFWEPSPGALAVGSFAANEVTVISDSLVNDVWVSSLMVSADVLEQQPSLAAAYTDLARSEHRFVLVSDAGALVGQPVVVSSVCPGCADTPAVALAGTTSLVALPSRPASEPGGEVMIRLGDTSGSQFQPIAPAAVLSGAPCCSTPSFWAWRSIW
ncbi:MAG: hypothetical protein AAFU77_16035 [Myxococcota bacterium]